MVHVVDGGVMLLYHLLQKTIRTTMKKEGQALKRKKSEDKNLAPGEDTKGQAPSFEAILGNLRDCNATVSWSTCSRAFGTVLETLEKVERLKTKRGLRPPAMSTTLDLEISPERN